TSPPQARSPPTSAPRSSPSYRSASAPDTAPRRSSSPAPTSTTPQRTPSPPPHRTSPHPPHRNLSCPSIPPPTASLAPIDPAHRGNDLGAPSIPRSSRNGWERVSLA